MKTNCGKQTTSLNKVLFACSKLAHKIIGSLRAPLSGEGKWGEIEI